MTREDRQFITDLIAPLAAKEDLKTLATKDELRELVTKKELKGLATRKDLETLATKDDLTREIESLAAMTQKGFDEVFGHIDTIKYRLGNVESKLGVLATSVEKREFDVAKIKHRMGLP